MGRMKLAALAISMIALFAPNLAEAQLLERASSAVREGDASSNDDDDDDDDGELLSSASDAVRGGSDGDGGGSSRGDSGRRSSGGGYSFAGAGYGARARSDWDGCPIGLPYDRDWDALGVVPEEPIETPFAARLESELGWAIGGAARLGFGARLQVPYFDLTARYSVFMEPVEGGVLFAALGRFGVELRVLDERVLQLRVGGGLRHFQDDVGGLFGGDALLGFDIFPADPVVLSGEVSVGVVGQAVVVQARGEIGVMIDAVELYAGYDYEALFAGGDQVDLGGPMLGVRGWM